MESIKKLKYQLLLLTILAIASGIILVLPHQFKANEKLTGVTPKVNVQKNSFSNCEGPSNKVTKALNNDNIDLSDKDCIYVGCGGFVY